MVALSGDRLGTKGDTPVGRKKYSDSRPSPVASPRGRVSHENRTNEKILGLKLTHTLPFVLGTLGSNRRNRYCAHHKHSWWLRPQAAHNGQFWASTSKRGRCYPDAGQSTTEYVFNFTRLDNSRRQGVMTSHVNFNLLSGQVFFSFFLIF